MRKIISSLFIFYILYFIFYIPARGDVSSQPIYGGGQTSVTKGFISIDKKVASPESQNSWVDNLNINDPKYTAESIINFQINLTNTGDAEIKQINVKDVFPQFVNFSSGPGSYDPNTKTLSFQANNLKPKEIRIFIVVGKVASANQLPITNGTICMANQVTASATDSDMSQDIALFCVQKEVLGTQGKRGFPVFPPEDLTTTPATGPETLLLFSLLPAGIAGWMLRKHAIKKIKD